MTRRRPRRGDRRGARIVSVACALLTGSVPGTSWPERTALHPRAADARRHDASAAASSSQVLLLEEVLAAVRAQHPLVEASRAAIDRAGGEVLAAQGGFDPTLELQGAWYPHGDYVNRLVQATIRQPTPFWGLSLLGGWRLSGGDFPLYKGDEVTAAGGEGRLGLELPLLRDGPIDSRRAGLASARQRRAVAGWQFHGTELELLRRATHAYWDWVAAGRRLAIAAELLEIARTRDGALAERVQRGDLALADGLDNQRAILKRQGRLIKAQRAFDKASIALSLFWRDAAGRPQRAPLSALPHELPRPTAAPPVAQQTTDLTAALSRRPDLRELDAQAAGLAIQRDLARNQRWPLLAAFAGSTLDLGDVAYRSARSDLRLGLKLELALPQRSARGRLRSAEAELAGLAAKQRLLRETIAAQLQDAHSALAAAQQQALFAEREGTLAHRLEAMERERLELGNSTLFLVNLREQEAAEAEGRAIDAAAGYQRAWADYQLARGQVVTGPSASSR